MHARAAIGFGFTSNWFKKWRENFELITEWSNAKPKQFANYFQHSIGYRFTGMAVHEWSCLSGLSVDEFQDLPVQFGHWASFESLKLQSVLYFAGRTGWPDTYKKIYEMEWQNYPEFILGMEATVTLINWLNETMQ